MLATWGPKQSRVSVTEKAKRVVCWFSCGAASAVATKLALDEWRSVLPIDIVYCDTGSEHPDNVRFMADCVRWFNQDIITVKNERYQNIFDVFRQRQFIKGPHGAPCTDQLKKEMRRRYERFDDAQIFGYDLEEIDRRDDFNRNNPEVMLVAPLIEREIGHSICSTERRDGGERIKVPVYLDELAANRGRYKPPAACGATGCERD